MKIILLFLTINIFLFGKDFYFKDRTKIIIEKTNYGILVDGKYKLKYINEEHIANGEFASIYENKLYRYSISCEGSFCDVVIINKTTQERFYAIDE